MIAPAIYNLLNTADVTDLVNGIYYTVAPQLAEYPYITFEESGENENYKNGSTIINHRLLIDIYCSKGLDGNGGFEEATAIAEAINDVLDRQSGTFAGVNIQQIYKEWQQAMYDSTSQAARIILEYRVRQRVSLRIPRTVLVINGKVLTINTSVITL